MKLELLGVDGLAAAFSGCSGAVYVGHPYRPAPVVYQPAPAVVYQPGPVVVAQPAPVYVEEGAMGGGVVVAAPMAVDGYVQIGGGWYYWHPGARTWVRAHRPDGWHPPREVRVYHGWAEHPMYVAQPAPVVVAPPRPLVVAPPPVAAPVFVEEGAMVGGVVVAAPVAIDGYVMIGGGWYYWHPGVHTWVHAHRPASWQPPREVHVYHGWDEHPMYHRPEGHRP